MKVLLFLLVSFTTLKASAYQTDQGCMTDVRNAVSSLIRLDSSNLDVHFVSYTWPHGADSAFRSEVKLQKVDSTTIIETPSLTILKNNSITIQLQHERKIAKVTASRSGASRYYENFVPMLDSLFDRLQVIECYEVCQNGQDIRHVVVKPWSDAFTHADRITYSISGGKLVNMSVDYKNHYQIAKLDFEFIKWEARPSALDKDLTTFLIDPMLLKQENPDYTYIDTRN